MAYFIIMAVLGLMGKATLKGWLHSSDNYVQDR